MTKQEAIEKIEKYQCKRVGMVSEIELEEALNMAIEALEQIESGRYVKGKCSICSKEYGTLGCCTTVSNHWVYSCKEGMAQYAEALQQEPKRGKWVKKEHLVPLARDAEPLDWNKYDKKTHSELEEYWHCSECNYEGDRQFRPSWKYCPNCGVEMETRAERIKNTIMNCPYFMGKKTIDYTIIDGEKVPFGCCDLEFHYRKICPTEECICAKSFYDGR